MRSNLSAFNNSKTLFIGQTKEEEKRTYLNHHSNTANMKGKEKYVIYE